MSQWTHVNGNIRFDYLPISSDLGFEKELKSILGKIQRWEDEYHPGCSDGYEGEIPTGSEGSIEYEIHKSPRGYDVRIWGDLRDFGDEDKDDIIKWFDKIMTHKFNSPMFVRDAILEIQVEYGKTYVLRDWFDDKNSRTYKIDEIESEAM